MNGILFVFAIILFAARRMLRGRAARIEIALAVRDGTLTPALIAAVPARPGFVPTESTLVGGDGLAPSGGGAARDGSASGGLFRQATSAMAGGVLGDAAPAALPQAVALRELRATLLTALDPAVTIGMRVRDRLQLADGLVWRPLDPLEPVIAGPDFPQPMYRYLAELSQEFLLPGLPDVGANTVTLAETNQAFVEAYMLGLNHEMASELLWREYPTDQRRTYFRQFWDPSAFLPPAGQARDNTALEDILPIHRWASAASLGANGARNAATGEQLVVLVRGDVVHRYPTLTCYAARAVIDDSGARAPGDEEQQPVFSGSLAPDIAFFGFPLTESQVRGGANAGGDLGWFFILQEHASEPRFGLDVADAGAPPPLTWNDLSWGELASAAEGLAAVDYIDLDADLPDTRGVTDPPGVAWHADAGLGAAGTDGAQIASITLQRPMRVAIHANDMLHV